MYRETKKLTICFSFCSLLRREDRKVRCQLNFPSYRRGGDSGGNSGWKSSWLFCFLNENTVPFTEKKKEVLSPNGRKHYRAFYRYLNFRKNRKKRFKKQKTYLFQNIQIIANLNLCHQFLNFVLNLQFYQALQKSLKNESLCFHLF